MRDFKLYKGMEYLMEKGKYKGETFRAYIGDGHNTDRQVSFGSISIRGKHTTKNFKLDVYRVNGEFYINRIKLFQSLVQFSEPVKSPASYKYVKELGLTKLIRPTGGKIYAIKESQIDEFIFALLKSGFNCYNIENILAEIESVKQGTNKKRKLKTDCTLVEEEHYNG